MRGNSTRLEESVEGFKKRGSIEEGLVKAWDRGNPAAKKPHGPRTGELPELAVKADALMRDIEAFRASHPEVKGIRDFLSRTKGERDVLNEMLRKGTEATAKGVGGVRNNLEGLEAELHTAIEAEGVTRVSYKLKRGTAESEIDVVADGGRTWLDSKNTNPYTAWGESPNDLRLAQAVSTGPKFTGTCCRSRLTIPKRSPAAPVALCNCRNGFEEKCDPTLPIAIRAHSRKPTIILAPVALEEKAPIQKRRAEHAEVLEQQRHQQAADSSVAVEVGVDRLELNVQETRAHTKQHIY